MPETWSVLRLISTRKLGKGEEKKLKPRSPDIQVADWFFHDQLKRKMKVEHKSIKDLNETSQI